MEQTIPAYVARLARAAAFEDAAAIALEGLLGVAGASLAASAYAGKGRVLRGMVHLRPDDGYQRLAVAEHGGASSRAGTSSTTLSLPSATAWRWASKHTHALFIDVTLGTIEVRDRLEEIAEKEQRFEAGESRARLLGREATHMIVVPLRAPGGAVAGMIAIEAQCSAAIGKTSVFALASDQIELLSVLAAPYLTTLPLRRPPPPSADELLPVVGASMAGLVEMLRVFAQQDETLLLRGPTGAGKSRLARWCHERSGRRGKPFEALLLSAVPEDLQLERLFGHKRGAFTGAVADSPGAVARAEGGTLFIDEIDKLSLDAQASLLQLIDEHTYRPIGDNTAERKADVRFIAGTNADLMVAVAAGRFLEDLLYRINVLPIKVPPLSARADEIPRWAEFFLERATKSAGVTSLAPQAIRLLVSLPWPGNLRQLDTMVKRAYALAILDRGASTGALVIGADHVERALSLDEREAPRSIVKTFYDAAAAFVAEAERVKAKGGVLDLDGAEAIRGFVLAAAIDKLGGADEALSLLGKEVAVQSRNAQRTVKREMAKVEELCRAAGEVPPAFIARSE